ncbi:EpsD family peptidyl-prolyl cis-trans isomerase [Methylophaga sp. OBS3]|uniref:EpsD family peptidyl-prolyl cis-trans isomerase n=1 Tax=Methylophaga sp. OBS3 TaxID=2991934 RepID=UPI0022584202|nr:EpsD family peptidyl-prolyl cis-trans isomerase [Methylophaga sp. OBS3]MCX4189085.1 EpsD family peptidyl-prolyl cis-trans isomerase [Methylophaga sp. OBS3]
MSSTLRFRLLSALIIIFLAGCEDTTPKENTQVVATVNNQEITVHQLNQAISTMGEQAQTADMQSMREAVLQNMIVQTLMQQEANKADLDRDPQVMQSIEAAKRQVLALAYMQQYTTITPSVSDTDVEAYYASNTDLFANRKLFVYDQVTVASDSPKYMDAQKKLQQIDDLKNFTVWLENNNVTFTTITKAKTSENIQPNLLKALSTLDVGQVGFLNLADGLVIIEVKDKQQQPVKLEMAAPAIKTHLQNQQRKQQVEQVVAMLKQDAVIKYSDEYQPASASDNSNASNNQNGADLDAYIEKGLAGIE